MPSTPRQTRFQQTRFHRQVDRMGEQFVLWARNPWRRLSLQLIVLLLAFGIGGGLGTITGALSYFDPVSALLCVALLEAGVRVRGRLLRRVGDRLPLQLLDMARIGLVYGLLLDGFKLL